MANKIRSNNEFARRVAALGLTFVELAEITGYNVRTLYNISCDQQPVSKRLEKMLERLESEHVKKKR